jgi:hypothetical protein
MKIKFYDEFDHEIDLQSFFRFGDYDGASDKEGSIEVLERRVENFSTVLENLIIWMITENVITLRDLETLQEGTMGYKRIHRIEEVRG